jgi:hypothetical protein
MRRTVGAATPVANVPAANNNRRRDIVPEPHLDRAMIDSPRVMFDGAPC